MPLFFFPTVRWIDITLSEGRSWQERGQGKTMEIVYLNVLKIIYHGIGLKNQRDIAEQTLVRGAPVPYLGRLQGIDMDHITSRAITYIHNYVD